MQQSLKDLKIVTYLLVQRKLHNSLHAGTQRPGVVFRQGNLDGDTAVVVISAAFGCSRSGFLRGGVAALCRARCICR